MQLILVIHLNKWVSSVYIHTEPELILLGKRGLLPAHDRDMYTKKTTDVEKLYATSQTERKRC